MTTNQTNLLLFEKLSEALAAKLEQLGITEEDLLAGLPEVREELAREHYPELFIEDATDVH